MPGALLEPGQGDLFEGPIRRKYVIKRHDSQVPHHDLRLVYRGVAVSWMLLGHPCLDPQIRVEAITRPDHNPKHLYSERVISEGLIGAGPTLVSDEGDYWFIDRFGSPIDRSLIQAKDAGRIDFCLEGYKLRGAFSLVHVRRDKWHLIKLVDKDARIDYIWNDISVRSGRTIDQIR